jgi:WD40 repeat protein
MGKLMKPVHSHVLPTGDDFVPLVANYSPDGELLVLGGRTAFERLDDERGVVAVFDAHQLDRRVWSSKLVSRSGNSQHVSAVAVSHHQALLAVACCASDAVELYETTSWQSLDPLMIYTPPYRRGPSGLLMNSTVVATLTFSAHENILAAGCWDTTVKLWDIAARSMTEFSTRKSNNQDFVAFADDGRTLVSGTSFALYLWSRENGSLVKKIECGEETIWQHVALPAQRIASVSHRGIVRLWDLSDGSYEEYRLRFRPLTALAYSPHSDLLAIGISTGEIFFWDVAKRQALGKWQACSDWIRSLAFCPTRSEICAVSGEIDQAIVFEY